MRALIWTIPLLLALAGCATGPKQVEPVEPVEQLDPASLAFNAFEARDYYKAARLFSSLIEGSGSPEREAYQLYAAESYLKAGMTDPAQVVLDSLPRFLPADQGMHRQLLNAEIALQSDPDKTLSILLEPLTLDAKPERYAQYHLLRALAFARLGNHLEAAREYIRRERFLMDEMAIETNQFSIWESLSQLSNEVLRRLRIQPPPDVMSGWMELVEIGKNADLTPDELSVAIGNWRARYPQHPIRSALLEGLAERSRNMMVRPGQVAILLPFSGRFASAGAAVRDGLLAAYYDSEERNEFTLRFYDEAVEGTDFGTVYEQALAEGAEMIIGPLDKEHVRELAQRDSLPTVTIGLNYAEPPQNDQLFQFSLAPEDEAKQIAELAWLDGMNSAAILVPDGNWGERLAEAFKQRWEEFGGELAAIAHYDSQVSDFSLPIKNMLNINHSESRRSLVQQVIGERAEFEPRRRQDIDFIFMAGFPRQARLIRPQLRFHHAIGIPVYSTSHVYSGTVDRSQDRDMDGIVFGDMPWTLGSATPYSTVRSDSQPLLKQYGGSLQRLVAMGFDAFHLMARLNMLDSYPNDSFAGETGRLKVDDENRIVRQLQWAEFVRGQPKLIDFSKPRGVEQ